MKIGYLTQARPEMLARIPKDIPHVVAHAEADGKYAPEMLAKLADVDAGPHAHTVEVNPITHEVYLPLENWQGKPVLRILQPPK